MSLFWGKHLWMGIPQWKHVITVFHLSHSVLFTLFCIMLFVHAARNAAGQDSACCCGGLWQSAGNLGNLSRSNLKPLSDTLLFSRGTAPFENGVICYTMPVAPLSCPAVGEISALNAPNCDCCALTQHDITNIGSWANPSGATVRIDIWIHKLGFLALKIDWRSCFCGLGKAAGQQFGSVCRA